MTKYLVDTCVWRDFYENRTGLTGNNLGKHAAKFFSKVIENEDKILFSEFLIDELKIQYSDEEITNFLSIFIMMRILKRINITNEEIYEAEKLSTKRNLPFVDCLDAVQARNHNAILISQDKHFQKLSDITKTMLP